MHEISLIRNIFGALEAEFNAEELAAISKIELKVGQLSNVEPTLMQNAFAAVTETEGRFENVQLDIIKVPITVECPMCTSVSTVEQYKFVCGNCGHPTNNVITGTELLIHRVHFTEATPQS